MPRNVQVHRYIDALRKKLGVQGHVGLNLVDDCLPVWDLYGDAPEDFFLREESRFSWTVAFGALAANYNRVFLTNSSATKLVVIEKILALTNDATWGRTASIGSTALGGSQSIDFRIAVSPSATPVIRVTGDNNPAQGLTLALGFAPAGLLQEPGIVLPPTFTLGIASNVVNVAQSFWIQWREFTPSDEEARG